MPDPHSASLLQSGQRLALRPREAAAALGISERTLRSLLPRLPHMRLDGAVLIPVDSLRRWLSQNAEAPGDRVDRLVAESLGAIRR
jgi:hypothetical protein